MEVFLDEGKNRFPGVKAFLIDLFNHCPVWTTRLWGILAIKQQGIIPGRRGWGEVDDLLGKLTEAVSPFRSLEDTHGPLHAGAAWILQITPSHQLPPEDVHHGSTSCSLDPWIKDTGIDGGPTVVSCSVHFTPGASSVPHSSPVGKSLEGCV